jgi:predicted dehydrogenase
MLHVDALKRQKVDGWRAEMAAERGGALLEGGIHWVSFMAHLGLEVRDARGVAATGTRGEGGVVAVFEYVGGAVGTLLHSWETPSPLGGLRGSCVHGREGSIAFESNGLAVVVWGRRKRLIFPGVRDLVGRRAMWRDFLRALRGNTEPEYDLALARRDMELVERIVGTLG